jgi:hypothetical protein
VKVNHSQPQDVITDQGRETEKKEKLKKIKSRGYDDGNTKHGSRRDSSKQERRTRPAAKAAGCDAEIRMTIDVIQSSGDWRSKWTGDEKGEDECQA